MTTEDGGKTWDTVSYIPANKDEIAFSEVQILEDTSVVISGWRGYIIKSTDRGKTWFDLKTGLIQYYTSMSFPSAQVGYVMSSSSDTLIKTSDGGTSWEILENPLVASSGIHFFDNQNGVICGNNAEGKGEVFTTTDGGVTWTPVFNDDTQGFAMLSASNGVTYIGTVDGDIYSSKDNGANWVKLTSPSPDNYILDIHFFNDQLGWVAVWTGGGIYATTDGGKTWRLQYENNKKNRLILDIYFLDAKHGFACGSNYVFLETFTGGWNPTGVEDDYEYETKNSILVQLYPNPSSGQIRIETPLSDGQLKVFDISGSLVFSKHLAQGKSNVGLNLPAGTYIVEFRTEKSYKVEKIIIQ
jgi:photosystem II stability/assembly factor-like uncharacterized protein